MSGQACRGVKTRRRLRDTGQVDLRGGAARRRLFHFVIASSNFGIRNPCTALGELLKPEAWLAWRSRSPLGGELDALQRVLKRQVRKHTFCDREFEARNEVFRDERGQGHSIRPKLLSSPLRSGGTAATGEGRGA